MDYFVFGAPVAGAFDVDVGIAFVGSVVGILAGFAPAVLAVGYVVRERGVRGLIPKFAIASAAGRISRRAA